ncbi:MULTISPECIES: DUF4148 domain-containing protein [Herbaspirillum]|jgi:hypothetical protein|uniref:DUF4148 domain-containing protein n=2 Tax=Herbaspirillum huttiense TaxID=863372 RepID=A0AAJ2HJ67_9BURK|nr:MULTISPECIES: DUF4148 domain-containing protein [Herbaspirillum]MCI1014226.1 DUF4148 domain-containing protein [Herbaspirillum sp. C7C2]MDR9839745.1 DUF4148 domain-containing protein [Herbaspirillum huttiense]MEE1639656.1 DUF4148 domain-containing protein [Herbaspirillum huttiense NC40101]MRT31057.1 DUF4148 domain-containing protein [Herbaspirillum sp. CAH-3]
MTQATTRVFAFSLLAFVASAAFAQSGTPEVNQRDAANVVARNNYPIVQFVSTKTRADVLAELQQAQREGLITNGNDYPIVRQASSQKTRAEVQHEVSTAGSVASSLYQGA